MNLIKKLLERRRLKLWYKIVKGCKIRPKGEIILPLYKYHTKNEVEKLYEKLERKNNNDTRI